MPEGGPTSLRTKRPPEQVPAKGCLVHGAVASTEHGEVSHQALFVERHVRRMQPVSDQCFRYACRGSDAEQLQPEVPVRAGAEFDIEGTDLSENGPGHENPEQPPGMTLNFGRSATTVSGVGGGEPFVTTLSLLMSTAPVYAQVHFD